MVVQEYFWYNESSIGFLKAQIVVSQCSLSREQIIELYDYRMIDYIIFSKPKDSIYFGEKMQIVFGNMTVSDIVQAQFYSATPRSYGLTREPAKHEIFVVLIR